jgi:hypothetical protein
MIRGKPNAATQHLGGSTMKTTTKYIAPWLAAAAIGGAIGLAPIASAAPATTPGSHDKVVPNTTASTAPAPTPFESGTDPRVPSDVGADPLVPFVPGTGRPF